MNTLVIDVGGTNVKILVTGQSEPRKFPSGPELTPALMVEGVKSAAADGAYDRVSIGYAGPVAKGRPLTEPHHLAPGWIDYDFAAHFGKPGKMLNGGSMRA